MRCIRLVLEVALIWIAASAPAVALHCAMEVFEFAINREGTMCISPIMMLQGAPYSHYFEEHRTVVWLHLACANSPVAVWGLFLTWAVGWRAGLRRACSRGARVASTVVFAEACVCVVSIPVAAALAFHHVGHGAPCNPQPVTAWIMANLFFGAPLMLFLVALDGLSMRLASAPPTIRG